MRNDLHGIIYTLHSETALRELVEHRNSASIPFGGRYRLIDFALSAMVNAGIRDVGVIMERDYQSLLDHLSNGADWGLARRSGGLRLLPPFGLPDAHSGHFSGCMEALRSVRSYIQDDIPQGADIVLCAADWAGNIDLNRAVELHRRTGAEITAVCSEGYGDFAHHRLVVDDDGFARRLVFSEGGPGPGLFSREIYIIKRDLLLELMDYCSDSDHSHFHRDALAHYLAEGGRIAVCEHNQYARRITSVRDYFDASMELIQPQVMAELFPADGLPIRTKERAEASTYYSDTAVVRSSLVADGCYIEGELDSCILFRGVRVAKGAKLKNCVLMQDTVVEAGAELRCVIADKDCVVTENCFLAGSERLPLVIPKGEKV